MASVICSAEIGKTCFPLRTTNNEPSCRITCRPAHLMRHLVFTCVSVKLPLRRRNTKRSSLSGSSCQDLGTDKSMTVFIPQRYGSSQKCEKTKKEAKQSILLCISNIFNISYKIVKSYLYLSTKNV